MRICSAIVTVTVPARKCVSDTDMISAIPTCVDWEMAVRIPAFVDEVNLALGSIIDSITSFFNRSTPKTR